MSNKISFWQIYPITDISNDSDTFREDKDKIIDEQNEIL